MKLKQPFALTLDFALQPHNSAAPIGKETGQQQWAPVPIKHSPALAAVTRTSHCSRLTLPAVPRSLPPRDRQYFRALRQKEIKAWLAADKSTPESLNELIS